MALVEGAIRRCSLRLIKSKTLSPSLASIRMGGGWRVEGEDETLNISGLCLPAATMRVTSSYCHMCLRRLRGPAMRTCVIGVALIQASDKQDNTIVSTNSRAQRAARTLSKHGLLL